MRFTYDPTLYSIFFDDFHSYNASDWTLTTVEAGAGDATEAVGNLDGGVLVLTNDAADNDGDQLQWPKECFKYVAGKRLHFAARFKLSDVVQSDALVGLAITDTTLLASAPSDGIFFRKDDGDALLDLVVTKNSTETIVPLYTMVNDTFLKAEFVYDGATAKIMAFVNGVGVGSAALTNVPDDEELAVSAAILNGEAVAKIMSIDYLFAAKER